MTKRSFDLRVAYPDVKVQVRDLMRVVGIVSPLPQGVSVPGQNIFLSSPSGLMDTGDLFRVPLAAVRHGSGARQGSGTVLVGIVEVSSGVSIRGKFVLSRKLGNKTRGLHLAKYSSE